MDQSRAIVRPPCRLSFFLAGEASLAAILRRGPAGWVRLILWDTRVDKFTPGQWLHARVYERNADLSPDGRYFIYYARDGRPHRDFETWTAISRPPDFTAQVLWHSRFPGGGGIFLDKRTVLAPPGLPVRGQLPTDLRSIDGPSLQAEVRRQCVLMAHRRQGWRLKLQWKGRDARVLVQETIGDRKRHSALLHDWLKQDPEDLLVGERYNGVTTCPPRCLFDQRDRLIYVRRGKLWRIEGQAGALKIREIADLNTMQPEPAGV